MLAGKEFMERHNQVAGAVHRNICINLGLETPRSKWNSEVVENDGAKISMDYQTRDTMAVDTVDKEAVVIDVPNDSNIRKTEHVKLEEEPVSEKTVGEDVGD